MKYVNNFDEYQSSSNNDLIRRISGINERFGTPQILKPMFDKVFQLINNMISNNLNKDKIHLNGSYISPDGKIFEFDKIISIEIYNNNRIDIYSKSTKDNILFKFNFESYSIKELKKVILHELLHIYEIYFRIKNEKNSLQWSLNKILSDISDDFVSDNFLDNLIYMIYLSFDHEIGARVCETYMVLIDLMIDDKEILMNELKETTAWKYKKQLSDFVVNNVNYNNLFLFFENYNSSINKKHSLNNKIFRVPTNIKDTKVILKEYLRIFKKKSKKFEDKLIKVVDDVLFDVEMINKSTINEFSNFEITYPTDLLRESKIRKLFREDF
jgi:predicted metal-dependent hydrolase